MNQAVTVLWDYMQLKQPVKTADLMIVLGSRDDRVAIYAAELFQKWYGQAMRSYGWLSTSPGSTHDDMGRGYRS